MSNTRNTGFLTNVIKTDSEGNVTFVSGSTTLLSISSSGAVTTTGVISGSNALSASYALNADQVDGLNSTSFVFTSSYNSDSSSFSTRVSNTESTGSTLTSASASLNTASGSFSTRVTRIEGNYATTGSNVFLGAQTVCANITSTGTIIAQTLNVQQVTSSVVYSSGSNVFGCSLTNTQQFTGSVLVTGSLVVTTTAPELTVGATGVTLGNATTDIHQVTGSLRITGSLNAIGISCFSARVCAPSLTISNTNSVLTIQGTATPGEAQLDLEGKNSSGTVRSATFKYDSSDIIRLGTSSNITMRFETNDTTRLCIMNTGIAVFACQVCAGGRISAINSGVDGAFADTFVGIYSGNNNEQNAIQTSVSSIAESSGFLFMVSCGAGLSTRSCGYRMVRNRHTFYVNNSCAVTIDSSGQVGIGTNPGSLLHTSGPSNVFKHFTTTNNGTWIEFQANSTNVVRPFYVGQDNSAGGSFGVGGYAGVIFTSSGDPVVLATASTARLTVAGNGIATFACQVCAPIFTTVNGVVAVGAGPSTTDIFTATGPVSSNGMYLILYNQQGDAGGSTGMAFINIWNNTSVNVYNVYCLGLSNVVNSGTTIRLQSLSGNGGFTGVFSAIRLR